MGDTGLSTPILEFGGGRGMLPHKDRGVRHSVSIGRHTLTNKNGALKKGTLLLCVLYELFHATLRAELPSVHFFIYMDDPSIAVLGGILHLRHCSPTYVRAQLGVHL